MPFLDVLEFFTAISQRLWSDGIFFKSLNYIHELGRTNFSAVFGRFGIFYRNFAKIVEPPSDNNKNSPAHLKGQSLRKNGENTMKI